MKLKAIIICAAALCAQPSLEATADDLEKCVGIKDDMTRLACYDRRMAKKVRKTVTIENPEGEAEKNIANRKAEWRANWTRREDVSGFNDQATVTLISTSKAPFKTRFKSGNIALIIRCKENTTSSYFHFDGLFMSDLNHGRVEYRIDKQKPASRKFRESNDHEALGLWNGGSSIPFIKSLFGAEKLLVRATPHSESPVTGEFKIGGLEEAIEPLRKACHW